MALHDRLKNWFFWGAANSIAHQLLTTDGTFSVVFIIDHQTLLKCNFSVSLPLGNAPYYLGHRIQIW